MPTKILNVNGVNYTPYESEPFSRPELGGACVARMILNSHKVNPTATSVQDAATVQNQQDMYGWLRARNTADTATWYVNPDGMRATLNDLDTGPRGYVEYSYTDKNQLNAKGIYTINTYDIAPAILQAAGKAWIALTGYTTDDSSNLINVNVHDPSAEAGLEG